MKRKNIMCSIVLLITILITILSAQEKNKYGKYPPYLPNPQIFEYPSAIQRLDSIKFEYYQNLYRDKNFKLSKTGLKEYANAFISSYMYYSEVLPNTGYLIQYFNESYPIGGDVIGEFRNLQYPWGFLVMKKGLIMGEIIQDELLEKERTAYPPPPVKIYEYVATVRVIDDIFNSYNGDTILVRHNHSLFDDYNDLINAKLLFTFKPGGSVQRPDSVQYIYLTGRPNEFMFVKDNIIHDPNRILKNDGKKYDNFKDDLLSFIKKEGISK